MPTVHWILKDGRKISAEVKAGDSLMEAALQHNVPGIVGECGGSMSCATCHVVVDDAWMLATGSAGPLELSMLEATAVAPSPRSRLSCQICAADTLNGLVLHVP
jgi:ferredoxin, 2Fe-2S